MANRTVKTIVTADVSGFVGGMAAASASAKNFAVSSARDIKSTGAGIAAVAAKNKAEWDLVSTTMLAAGAAIAGGLGLAAKAAMDWESSWTGVTKTVDGSGAQMAVLEGQLRSLARTLPASHAEIAAVAEAAGQLGIQRQNVAGFTKTMIDLGETTNLSADEAATSLAQLMNIMGTSASNVSRLGSTLVALGNAGASTERQILEMGMRISAAGKQVGMSETDVLALSSALASVGIEAEAGGTSTSMALMKIDAAVRSSGDGLQQLAKLTGMSADEFRQAWEGDAAGAMASVVEGLGKVQSSGGSVRDELTKLGITGQRESDAMGRLASSTKAAGASQDLLRDSISLGKKAWDENNALVTEAAKRYETTASKAQVAWNNIVDSGITMGAAILPVISGIMQSVTGLASAFGSLPNPVQQTVVAVAALGAGALLLGGGLMKAIGWAHEMRAALLTLRGAVQAANISMSTAGVAAAGIGIALTVAGLSVARFMQNQQRATDITNNYAEALKASAGAIDESVRATAAKQLSDDGALDAADKLGISLSDVTDAALGNADAMKRVQEAVDGYKNDTVWDAGARTNRLSDEAKAARELEKSLKTNSESFQSAATQAKQYEEATSGTAAAADSASSSTSAQTAATEAQRKAMTGLLEATQAYANELLKLSGDQIALEAAIDDASAAIAKNGRTLDINSAAGRANQTALNSLASAGMSLISTLVQQGASTKAVTAAQQRASSAFVEAAVKAGMTRDAAKKLADQYFAVPKNVKTNVTDNYSASASRARVRQFEAALSKLPKEKQSEIRAIANKQGIAAAESAINKVARNRVASITISTGQKWSGSKGGSAKAYGGITEFYGMGGVRDVKDKHIAEIAPAGAWRVWAEPETKGEAYVPLANDDRRPRAKSILSEVARRFGGEVNWFASGGVVVPASAPRQAGVDIDRLVSAIASTSARPMNYFYLTQKDPDAAAAAVSQKLGRLM